LTEPAGLFGLPGQRSIAVHATDDRFDDRSLAADGWSGAESILRRDGQAESRAGVEMRQAFFAGPVRAGLEARVERFGAAAASGSLVSPALSLAWSASASTQLFARASRGRDDFSRPLAAVDPWKGTPDAILDPDTRREFVEGGARWRQGALELSASAWRMRAPSRLAFTEGGPIETLVADERRGYGFGLRYQPVPWLDLHADALLAAAERMAGAPGAFGSAGATVRVSRDWDARLAVNYLGPRDAAIEGLPLRSTTLVNAQVVRWLGNTTRVSFDVFNQRLQAVDSFAASRAGMLEGIGETFLSSPAEPRGFLLKLRTHF
jgi:TonB-dependent receptor-like protein